MGNHHMERNEQISVGVFLIGLAMLFITGFWWPGILLVMGAAALAKGAMGSEHGEHWGGLWLIGLGLFFVVGFRWELLLIFVGVSMLLGYSNVSRCGWGNDDKEKRKRKNDEKTKRDPEALGDVEWI